MIDWPTLAIRPPFIYFLSRTLSSRGHRCHRRYAGGVYRRGNWRRKTSGTLENASSPSWLARVRGKSRHVVRARTGGPRVSAEAEVRPARDLISGFELISAIVPLLDPPPGIGIDCDRASRHSSPMSTTDLRIFLKKKISLPLRRRTATFIIFESFNVCEMSRSYENIYFFLFHKMKIFRSYR